MTGRDCCIRQRVKIGHNIYKFIFNYHFLPLSLGAVGYASWLVILYYLLVLAMFRLTSVAFPSATTGRIPSDQPVQNLQSSASSSSACIICVHVSQKHLRLASQGSCQVQTLLPVIPVYGCFSMPQNVLCNRSMTQYYLMSKVSSQSCQKRYFWHNHQHFQ